MVNIMIVNSLMYMYVAINVKLIRQVLHIITVNLDYCTDVDLAKGT